jgi:hypothetical protein
MNEVLTKAVKAMYQDYEDLIVDPAGQIDKWSDYGTFDACRLCGAVSLMSGADKNPYYKHSCKAHCPLGPKNFKELNSCKKWPSCITKKSFFDELVQAIDAQDFEQIKEIAPKRLDWLKKRIGV